MLKLKFKTITKFFLSLRNLPISRVILILIFLLLAFLYPGHNSLQRLIIHPGEVRGLALPPVPSALYPATDLTPPPATSARTIVIQDVISKSMIYAHNPDTLVLPASTTKIMTALVALDTWPDLETVISVKNEDRAIGQTINLVRGEQLTVASLLSGLLIHSGNDAALALAENHPQGYAGFVAGMNNKAKALHLDHTVYKNPSGVEQYGHVTTARDLSILAGVAMQNPLIAELASTHETTIYDTTHTLSHYLVSTNELLGVLPGVKGLKTGWTENAGECLVSYVERANHPVIFVVMGSSDRFGDTTKLVDWTYAHHQWLIPSL